MGRTYTRRVGGTTVVLEADDEGMRRLLVDRMFAPTLMKHAEQSKARAVAAAKATPTRNWGPLGSQRRTQVRYENSFDVDAGYGVTAEGNARIYARVLNSNPFALYIEYGNRNLGARRIVRQAAGIYRFDAEGDKY